MAGSSDLDNAVLGGSADYITDIVAAMSKAYFASDDVKVIKYCVLLTTNFRKKILFQLTATYVNTYKSTH